MTENLDVRLPIPDSLDEKRIGRHFLFAEVASASDSSLTYRIVIPRNWEARRAKPTTELDPSQKIINLGQFVRPSEEQFPSIIEINYLELPREVDLGDWLTVYASGNDMKLVKWCWREFDGREMIDSLLLRKILDRTCVIRLAVLRNHTRIFLVSGLAEENEYSNHSETFGISVASFRLSEPREEPFAEPLERFDLQFPFPIAFHRPASFQIHKRSDQGESAFMLDLRASDKGDGPGHHIRVAVLKRTEGSKVSSAALFRSIIESLSPDGYKPNGEIEEVPLQIKGNRFYERGDMMVAPMRGAEEVAEVRALALRTDTAWYLIYVLAPDPKQQPLEWMVHKRAFEIITLTIQADVDDGCL